MATRTKHTIEVEMEKHRMVCSDCGSVEGHMHKQGYGPIRVLVRVCPYNLAEYGKVVLLALCDDCCADRYQNTKD